MRHTEDVGRKTNAGSSPVYPIEVKMAYEAFKKKLNKEDFFKTWDSEHLNRLTRVLKERIYEKYILKFEVFNRDSFTCQNENCKRCNNEKHHPKLTLHHIKWQKNGGENKERNGVTLCRAIHSAYHKAKAELVFGDIKNLPPHIRGHKFKLEKPDRIDWKGIKKDMKILRKRFKSDYGLRISYEQLCLLMKFLEVEFYEQE